MANERNSTGNWSIASGLYNTEAIEVCYRTGNVNFNYKGRFKTQFSVAQSKINGSKIIDDGFDVMLIADKKTYFVWIASSSDVDQLVWERPING